MNCPKCGQPVEAGAAFCGNCGQALTAAPAVAPPTPAAQAPTPPGAPIAQVLHNQAGLPSSPVNMSTPAAAGGMGGASTAAIPGYAVAKPGANRGETKAIIGLILGVIGLPAAILPILGLILGITGVILGTMARRQYKHMLSILAIIFSVIAIILSITVWGINIEHDPRLHNLSASNGVSVNGTVHTLTTDCYQVGMDTSLPSQGTGANCEAFGLPAGETAAHQTAGYAIDGASIPDLTADNFSALGPKFAQSSGSQIGANISNVQAGTFAGSPAYIGDVKYSSGISGQMAIVYHQGSASENVFIIASEGSSYTLHNLEAHWKWL